jgi:putative phosphoesterase
MLIALFSDIHSNIHTLTSGYKDAIRQGASKIFVAGDIVGRGLHPLEVIRFLQQNHIPAIGGNVERKLLERKTNKYGMSKMYHKKKTNLAWTALQMDKSAWDYIHTLPTELHVQIEGITIYIVHGSPLSDKDYIYPSITPRGIEAKMRGQNPDILVCGHSHVPFIKTFKDLRVINCGSIGMSIDGDPRPSYALIEISPNRSIRCRIVRFEYPLSDLIDALKTREAPGIDAELYMTGIKNNKD